jgi:hypothetical protein
VVTRAPLALAVAAAALLSCNTNFAPQYLVRDLRILAARAQVVGSGIGTADADAGETLSLTALVANPERLPGLTVQWKACLPQQGESVSPCLDPAVLRDPAALSGPGVVALGEGTSVLVDIPSALAPLLQVLIDRARSAPELACTLYAELPVIAIASAPGAETRLAVKTARLTPWREVAGTPLANAYVRNRNPGLDRVRARPSDTCTGGTTVARPCGSDGDCDDPGASCDRTHAGSPTAPGQCVYALTLGEQELCTRSKGDSVQIYNQCQTTGERDQFFEDLTYQWYATAGVFKNADGSGLGSNGNVTGDRVTFTPPVGPFTLWVIVRDGRGGEDWIVRDYP